MMRTIKLRPIRYSITGCIAAAALLVGCGGSRAGSGAGAMPQSLAGRARGSNSSGDLVYATTTGTGGQIFTYPSGSLVGAFSVPQGTPFWLCSDSKGDVFVLAAHRSGSGSALIYEFAHGSTSPFATLNVPAPYGAEGCASDEKTGNLAVTVADVHGNAELLVYQNALGSPAVYTGPYINVQAQPGYDNMGNLFVTSESYDKLTELPAGTTVLESVSINAQFPDARGVQWDGKYLAIEAPANRHGNPKDIPILVTRVSVSGSQAKIVSVVRLEKSNDSSSGHGWITNGMLLGPSAHQIWLYKYPKGKRLSAFAKAGRSSYIFGVTLSVGSRSKRGAKQMKSLGLRHYGRAARAGARA